MAKLREIPAHEQTITVRIPEWVPGHEERGHDMEDFQKNRQQMIDDGFGYCFGCDIAGIHNTSNLECHHFACEWAEWDDSDPESILKLVKYRDPYGYAAKMGDTPIENPNDIRNLLMLCMECHRGAPKKTEEVKAQPNTFISGGIHYAPEVEWYADRVRVRHANKEVSK